MTYGIPREHISEDGKQYVIRDVLTSHSRFAGFCQYKTRRADGVVVWKPCPEGAEYSQIEPYRIAA